MLDREETVSPNLRQISKVFRRTGWISFWAQLLLAIVSSLIFIFGGFATLAKNNVTGNNAPNGGGLFLAVLSLAVLLYGIYQSFQYVQIGRKLKSENPEVRPKKADTIQFLWTSLLIRGVGMALAIFSAEAIAGVLLGKALTSLGGLLSPMNQIVQPLDLFLLLGNTHTITAQFVGIVAAMFLLNRINR
ncbi:MAG: DUF3611 family protein [Alkalinema sp. RU_4_3]|nr:DUF3611 family protein [Alkalinema sp. RU_4_3]